jgi:UDP-N-acetylmuramoyl-tripeptide--D-alanyl-D-alanine ligase
MLTVADVVHLVGGALSESLPVERSHIPICGVEIDSRRIVPGQLFIAYRGEHLDGHIFAPDAVAAGASAVLVERPLTNLPPDLPQIIVSDPRSALLRLAHRVLQRSLVEVTIGITGSAGKTTTRHIVSSLLSGAFPGQVLEPPASYNTDTGLSLTILNQLTEQHRFAVFEMAAQRMGEIAALCLLAPPTIGMVTNVGPAHLEFFGSIENIIQAKGELIEALPSSGLAVLNAEDPAVRAMVYRSAAPAVFYGLSNVADYWGNIRSQGDESMVIEWFSPAGHGRARVQLLGQHNLLNIVGAIALAERCGVSPHLISPMLEGIQPVSSRLQIIPGPQEITIIDDSYNANRLSTQAALALLAHRTSRGRRIAILGDMFELGSYAIAEHHAVGQFAAGAVDELFAVGVLAEHIAEGARAAGMLSEHVHYFPAPVDKAFRSDPAPSPDVAKPRQELVALLQEYIQPGDSILFKAGRGMRFDYLVHLLRDALQQRGSR